MKLNGKSVWKKSTGSSENKKKKTALFKSFVFARFCSMAMDKVEPTIEKSQRFISN